MKLLIFLFVTCFSPVVQSQIIKVSSFDTFDWDHLGKNKDATFCVLDDKTGALIELRHYKNGKKHGLFLLSSRLLGDRVSYTESNYKKGVLHGFFKDYKESGHYKNGKKHGVWEYYNDMGFYEKVSYKNDKKHGAYLKRMGI